MSCYILHPGLGDDFTLPSPAEVSFLALDNPVSGATECINVIIDDDDNYEGDLMFMVAFGSLSVSSTLATTTGPNASVTIQDNGSYYHSAQCCGYVYTQHAVSIETCIYS